MGLASRSMPSAWSVAGSCGRRLLMASWITPAQLGYVLEGIDWRHPQRTWRPPSWVGCDRLTHRLKQGDGSSPKFMIWFRPWMPVPIPSDDVDTLKAALVAERARRVAAEALAAATAKVSDDQVLIAHLKLQIEKLSARSMGNARADRAPARSAGAAAGGGGSSATEDEITAGMMAARTSSVVAAIRKHRHASHSRSTCPVSG